LRGYVTSLDFRGRWINRKSNVTLLANIDLSYLTIVIKDKSFSFPLKKMNKKAGNYYKLTCYDGSIFWLKFESNQKLMLVRINLGKDRAGFNNSEITGVYLKRINAIKE
jgi:hypothetical protein